MHAFKSRILIKIKSLCNEHNILCSFIIVWIFYFYSFKLDIEHRFDVLLVKKPLINSQQTETTDTKKKKDEIPKQNDMMEQMNEKKTHIHPHCENKR